MSAMDGEPEFTLDYPWRVWAAENLLAGVPRAQVLATLKQHGAPTEEAARRVAEIEASPAFVAARGTARRVRQLELLTRVHEQLARAQARARAEPIERVARLDADAFFTRYYAVNAPVVFTELSAGWPALTKWSPAYFRERLADVTIEICEGRSADPDADINFREHTRTLTMAEYVDLVLTTATTDRADVYAIANNRNMERPGMAALLEDVRMPEGILDPSALPGCAALWFGPAGTLIPLHHDTSNILLFQIVGRKRVFLVPPTEQAVLARARGVYNRLDCENPGAELAGVPIRQIELQPGETLFIPIGWWHQVRALDVSISLGLNNFTRSNAFHWYKPGAVQV